MRHPPGSIEGMLIDRRCGSCGRPGPSPCGTCAGGAVPPARVPDVAGVDHLSVAFTYAGPVRELVLAAKYRGDRGASAWLARSLASAVPDPEPGTVVTWVPTTASRRRSRGHDQAEVLARRLASELGVPARSLLRRAPGPPQTGRSAAERALGPGLRARRAPVAVLLVDDVVTTGASLRCAAAALRRAGSSVVDAAAVAAAPGPTAAPIGTPDRSRGAGGEG